MSVLTELKRRNVYRVAAAYGIVGWMVVQVSTAFVPALNLPSSIVSLLAFLVVIGFPIALLLAWLYELTPEGLKRVSAEPAEQNTAPLVARKLDYVIAGGLVALLVFVVVDAYILRDETGAPSELVAPTAAATAAEQPLPNSVAVLPFENLSPDPDDAYFAQGIHEEVLNQLAKVKALNVIARTSVLRYAGGKMSVPEIARELNVQSVMEGSVRYAGDEVRITAQLIDAKTGSHLWSEAYQRNIDDIFAIQADIAMNIANALRAEFSLEEQRALGRPLTTSAEAYGLYLQAKIVRLSADGGAPSQALLDRAIALDPNFASAYGAKARDWSTLVANTAFGNSVPIEERADLERRVRDYAGRALALEPQNIQAREALQFINLMSWRWTEFRTPPDREYLQRIGGPNLLWSYAWAGDPKRVVELGEELARIDPNTGAVHLALGVLRAYVGDRSGSNRALQRALELTPSSAVARAWLAYNAAAVGDQAVALEDLKLLEQLVGGDNMPISFIPEIMYCYGRIGEVDAARRLFDRLTALADDIDSGDGAWVLAYLAVNDEERALEHLAAVERKARNHEPDAGYLGLMNLKMNFLADPRVETPRFAEALARVRGD